MSELVEVPGIGKTIAKNLGRVGIAKVEDFAGRNPDELYEEWCAAAEDPSDLGRCVSYLFREAVYYAEGGREPEKLKWWNWRDKA